MWIAACSPVSIRKRCSGALVTKEGTLPTGKEAAELEHSEEEMAAAVAATEQQRGRNIEEVTTEY